MVVLNTDGIQPVQRASTHPGFVARGNQFTMAHVRGQHRRAMTATLLVAGLPTPRCKALWKAIRVSERLVGQVQNKLLHANGQWTSSLARWLARSWGGRC